jgi:hypothetical protein
MGSRHCFRDWITAFLITYSLRVLLNGQVPIKHGRGLRQGAPFPLPFVLAIDPLKQILELATQHELLHKIRWCGTVMRTSHYEDDAIIFVHPAEEDIQNLSSILTMFGELTGLATNFQKSMVVPIRCYDIDLNEVLNGLPVIRGTFPIKYLGLLLSV